MARTPAEVISGARGPILRGEQVREPEQPKPVRRTPAQPGKKRYISRAAGYRFQIDNPADVYDPQTGRKTVARPKVAKFSEGLFETDDPVVIERLEASAAFGMGRDFWLESEAQRLAIESQKDLLIASVKALGDEAVTAQIVEALGGRVTKDFELPSS